jgi:hypothetical protein
MLPSTATIGSAVASFMPDRTSSPARHIVQLDAVELGVVVGEAGHTQNRQAVLGPGHPTLVGNSLLLPSVRVRSGTIRKSRRGVTPG